MTTDETCPACGHTTAHRAVSTYTYHPTHGPGDDAYRRTDAFYCGNCGHTWERQQAEPQTGAWMGRPAAHQ